MFSPSTPPVTNPAPTLLERIVTLILGGGWFIIVYNGCNWYTARRTDVRVSMFSWEPEIPFVPWMIVPYWSIDLFFVASFFVCTRRSELVALTRRILTAISIAGIFFLLFPLELGFTRPAVEGALGVLFSSLENFDNFHNCAPSLHIALRTILWPVYVSRTTGALNVAIRLWFLLIGLSTLLCWQHHLIDVVTGQLLGLSVLHLIPERRPVHPTIAPEQRINGSYRIGARYLGVAACFLGLTLAAWPAGVLMLWPAIAFLFVALAYFGRGPCSFRKQHGNLPPSSRWLLAPYLIGAELSYRWYTRDLPMICAAGDDLYFGRKLREHETELLTGHHVNAVLDLTAEYSDPAARIVEPDRYENIPILDLTRPGLEQLLHSVDWIEAQRQNGAVFVHCSLGLSRSSMVVASWLLATGRADTIDSAIARVRECNPRIVLTEGFRLSLRELVEVLSKER